MYHRLLIQQPQTDGTTDYYALVSQGGDGKTTRYVFTGMRYKLEHGQMDPALIVLPIHLVGDIRIGHHNASSLISDAEYELHPISIGNSFYQNTDYLKLFSDFYASLGRYHVSTAENMISLTPKAAFNGAVALSIRFTEHTGHSYFAVRVEQ